MDLLFARLRLILHAFGWRGLIRRLRYVVALRSGALRRRLPVRATFATSPLVVWRHRFDLDEVREGYRSMPDPHSLRERVRAETGRLLTGEMRLYGGDWQTVGWPPRWHVNPFTANEYPRVHWTEISDDDPVRGDIKDVWEISRLPVTFFLARSFVLTGDDRYPEHWWELLEDWAEHNPPNLGVNWRCGQETSLRAISLCFGLSAFADHPASTAPRLDLAHRILGASVWRVQPTVGYALSQRNNHAVSELVFLLSVRAERDERRLLLLLLEVLDDQFYADGSYSQQSFTYQRLAVQALQWLLLTRPDLPPGARNRVADVLAGSRDFLARCSDPVSGWLPNYGPNDGALLFHLSDSHYRDFRPLLASLGEPSSPEHLEAAIWLERPQVSARTSTAGRAPTTYITLRGPQSLALSRIGTGRHRAAHGDQQAIDLWIGGRNAIRDPGTYRYTAPASWRNALTGPEVHSLALEDAASQVSIGRFLSEGMPSAELRYRGMRDDLEVVVSRRPSGSGGFYRAIVRRGDAYAIIDAAEGTAGRVRWNLDNLRDIDLRLESSGVCPESATTVDDPASGWVSDVYGQRRATGVRLIPVEEGQPVLCQLAPTNQHHLQPVDVLRAIAQTGFPDVSAVRREALYSPGRTTGGREPLDRPAIRSAPRQRTKSRWPP
jgi:hypothetical protein